MQQVKRRLLELCSRQQVADPPWRTVSCPLIEALLQNQHAVDALVKAGPAANSTEVSEVVFVHTRRVERCRQERADQRPCPATDVSPIIASFRDTGDGGRRVVASGGDQHDVAATGQRGKRASELASRCAGETIRGAQPRPSPAARKMSALQSRLSMSMSACERRWYIRQRAQRPNGRACARAG